MTHAIAEPHRRPRLPWALLGAIGILFGVEAFLRIAHWPRFIPYDSGGAEYHALAATLNISEPPEVVFIGSSRARESVYLPALRDEIAAAVGRPVSVANYGLSGARTHEFLAVTRRLLREPRPPRLILCGLSERDLARDPDEQWDFAPLFWSWSDWRRDPLAAMSDLPIVVRNHLGIAWRTLGLREALRMQIVNNFVTESRDAISSPIRGEETPWQRVLRGQSLRDHPVSSERLAAYLRTLHVDENYPNPNLAWSLGAMIDACKAANVALVLYEVPSSAILRDHLPPETYTTFVLTVDAAAREHGVRFVHVDELPAKFGDRHFLEQSHMNMRGGRTLGTALVQTVIADELKREPPPPPPPPPKRKRRSATTRAK